MLFALNGCHFVNEKGSVSAVDSFPVRPEGFAQSVRQTLGELGRGPAQLRQSLERMRGLVREVRALAG